jgi:hypothetical protein
MMFYIMQFHVGLSYSYFLQMLSYICNLRSVLSPKFQILYTGNNALINLLKYERTLNVS